jgi:hypothetical protein
MRIFTRFTRKLHFPRTNPKREQELQELSNNNLREMLKRNMNKMSLVTSPLLRTSRSKTRSVPRSRSQSRSVPRSRSQNNRSGNNLNHFQPIVPIREKPIPPRPRARSRTNQAPRVPRKQGPTPSPRGKRVIRPHPNVSL